MDEDPQYSTVVFTGPDVCSARGLPPGGGTVYEELKCVAPPETQTSVPSECADEAPPPRWRPAVVWTCLCVAAVLLVSGLVGVSIHLSRQTDELGRRNQEVLVERTGLQVRVDEVTAERDRLNWTVQVILTHKVFNVDIRCPHKVCRPCEDTWVHFESHCYWFEKNKYSTGWKTWQESQNQCRQGNADLVVIDSREEQDFISNHTENYNDNKHGYWTGLRKAEGVWTWVDGGRLSEAFWDPDQNWNRASCMLTAARADPRASWLRSSCEMKNRWICETRALVRHH